MVCIDCQHRCHLLSLHILKYDFINEYCIATDVAMRLLMGYFNRSKAIKAILAHYYCIHRGEELNDCKRLTNMSKNDHFKNNLTIWPLSHCFRTINPFLRSSNFFSHGFFLCEENKERKRELRNPERVYCQINAKVGIRSGIFFEVVIPLHKFK